MYLKPLDSRSFTRPGEAGYGADERVSPEKTGLTLEQMKTGIRWIYLAPYDRYYAEQWRYQHKKFLLPQWRGVDGGYTGYGVFPTDTASLIWKT